MKTYQDLMKITSESDRKNFIYSAINEYKYTDFYQTAVEAEQYERQLNPTIMRYKKLLYDMKGKAVPDNFTANHKCASNFFSRFVTQECQYLLGNGIQFNDKETKDKLGGSMLDYQLQKAGKNALVHGVSYGFFNLDRIDVFKATEFVPLWDEENGSLMAGIRYWQIDTDKPMRMTLFEVDGYTDYIRKDGVIDVITPKRSYKQKIVNTIADGTEIYDSSNYPAFPIVPLWGNPNHQSEIVGIKSQIDAYDLIKSGFANDLDDASMIYWTLENAGGMDDIDLAKFIERMKTVKAAVIEGDVGARAEAHTIDIPYQSREAYLNRLEMDLYNDAMALNFNQISSGNVTATAINASYEPLNNKTDQFEYCVIDFMQSILAIAGIEDEFTFKRSRIVNATEETQMILSAGNYLDDETILKHLPFLSPDEVETIMGNRAKEELDRFNDTEEDTEEQTETEE